MKKITNNLHYEILKAASNKNLFQEGISIELSGKLADLGIGKRKLNKKEILMFCAVFKFSIDEERSEKFQACKIKDFYKLKERSWWKWLNILTSLNSKGLIVFPAIRGETHMYDPDVFIDQIIYNRIMYGNDEKKDLTDLDNVFKEIKYIVEMTDLWKTSFIRFEEELICLIKKLDRNNPIKKIASCVSREETIFNLLIFHYYYGNISKYGVEDIKTKLYRPKYSDLFLKLEKKQLILQKKGIIGIVYEKGLFTEYELYIMIDKNRVRKLINGDRSNIISSDILHRSRLEHIKSEMIYPENIGNEIKRIKKALDLKNFNNVRKKLTDNGYSGALTFLIYGPSGTGKSRTVYEIAKETGRIVLEADLAKLKGGGLVGDQERETKRLFSEYRRLSKKCSKIPILLINEADSLLSNRVEVTHSASVGHNSQINIVLDELDKFNGILFATTNLKDNFDMAMDRRFLSKIEFPAPEKNVRAVIWKQKLPALSLIQCDRLSEYEISGGVIENIARKYTLASIFEMEDLNYNKVKEMAMGEIKFREGNIRKIAGFVTGQTA